MAGMEFAISSAWTGKPLGTFTLDGAREYAAPYAGELAKGVELAQIDELAVGGVWKTHADSRGIRIQRIT